MDRYDAGNGGSSFEAAYPAAIGDAERCAGSIGSKAGQSGVDEETVQDWFEAARHGDDAALNRIYERYKDDLFQTALMLLSSWSAAASATEEAFVAMATEAHPVEFVECEGFEAVLYRYLIWKCLAGMTAPVDIDGRRDRLGVDVPDRAAEIRLRIAEALAELDPGARVAFVLRESRGFSYERIAAITDVHLEAVAPRLTTARAQLATVLEEIEFEAWNVG